MAEYYQVSNYLHENKVTIHRIISSRACHFLGAVKLSVGIIKTPKLFSWLLIICVL